MTAIATIRYFIGMDDYSLSPGSKFGDAQLKIRNGHPNVTIDSLLKCDAECIIREVRVSFKEQTSGSMSYALKDYFDQVGNPKYVVKGSDFSVVEESLGQDDILIKPFLSLGNRKVVSQKSNFLARLV